jgi:hypothetical protein
VNAKSDPASTGTPLARRWIFVAVVTAAAVALAIPSFLGGFPELRYDSFHYYSLSRIISGEGLGNLQSLVRTYGYPLFLSMCTGFRNAEPGTTRALAFAAQLAIYLAACLYSARVARRVFRSETFFFATYAVMALNPIALIHATEVLTDVLSAVLLLVAVLIPLEPGRPVRRGFLTFLAAGLAVAVRPANLVVFPALLIVWLLRARRFGERVGGGLAAGAVGALLALLPQLYNNVRAYDAWTPLVVERLYGEQAGWGTAMLKYGTLVVAGEKPEIVYRNPFRPKGVSTPGQFLRKNPVGYLATLVLHGFALFDHDLPFAYVQNVRPWFRWPIALLNYAFLFLAGAGLFTGLAGRRRLTPPARLYFAAASLVSVFYVALYLPVAVESRFSLPLYAVLAPAAVFGILAFRRGPRGRTAAVIVAFGAFLALCSGLSLWLSAQAPVLVRLAGR